MNRPPRAFRPAAQSGLGLVELMLALAITALVMVPLLELLRTTAAASSHVTPRFALQREAAFAVQRIAAQVRAGVPITSFSRDGDRLVETNGTVASTLAGSVSAFSKSEPVAAAGQQLVLVSLTLTRDGASASAGAAIRAGGTR
jgi:Tfp pilus assembly protein PilW